MFKDKGANFGLVKIHEIIRVLRVLRLVVNKVDPNLLFTVRKIAIFLVLAIFEIIGIMGAKFFFESE